MNKNKIIKLIIVALIILIIVIIVLALFINKSNGKSFKSLNNDNEYIMEATPVQYLYQVMNKYRGFSSRNTINKTYYNFATSLVPKYKNLNLTEDEAKKYFNRNQDTIRIELGILNADEFAGFIKLVNSINDDKFKLKEYKIYSQSIDDIGDYLNVYLGVVYEGQNEVVFNSRIKTNPKEDETAIAFNANVNSEKIEKWKESESPNNNYDIKAGRGVPLEIAK